MLRCREISRLVSESMDRELPFRQRLQVGMHLVMCRLCYGFARQVRAIRTAARRHADRIADDASDPRGALSEESRERIKAALREERR